MVNWTGTIARRWVIAGFFLCGAAVTTTNSIILRDSYPWKNNLKLQFRKPWFQLATMYFGMGFFMIPSILFNKCDAESSLPISVSMSWADFRQAAAPSICSIIATALENKALLYIPATIWQMFFGFQVVFATLFAIVIRGQNLFLVDWMGLFISVIGMCFGGVAAFARGIAANDMSTIENLFLSFVLSILGHGIQAFQTILEERLLHDMKINSASLTAYEGIWGLSMCCFIVLPVCACFSPTDSLGFYENTMETFRMMGMSVRLSSLIVGFMIAVALFSFFGILVTSLSTAIHRNMYESVRPLVVWVFLVIVHYASSSSSDIGEPIDRFTSIELIGFCISVLGNLVYNRIIEFPCFTYVNAKDYDKDTQSVQPLLASNADRLYTNR
jgi:drug/metabolite transporter (DMT)-like permease